MKLKIDRIGVLYFGTRYNNRFLSYFLWRIYGGQGVNGNNRWAAVIQGVSRDDLDALAAR